MTCKIDQYFWICQSSWKSSCTILCKLLTYLNTNWLLYIHFCFLIYLKHSNFRWIYIHFDFDSMYDFVYTPWLNSLTSFYVSGSYIIESFYHLTAKERLLLHGFYMLWLSTYQCVISTFCLICHLRVVWESIQNKVLFCSVHCLRLKLSYRKEWLKPVFSVKNLETSDTASACIMLSGQLMVMTLIRLCGWRGWYVFLLIAP